MKYYNFAILRQWRKRKRRGRQFTSIKVENVVHDTFRVYRIIFLGYRIPHFGGTRGILPALGCTISIETRGRLTAEERVAPNTYTKSKVGAIQLFLIAPPVRSSKHCQSKQSKQHHNGPQDQCVRPHRPLMGKTKIIYYTCNTLERSNPPTDGRVFSASVQITAYLT